MSTRLIFIGLLVLLGHSIARSTGAESTGSSDLLAKLKAQDPSVDLHAFVQSDADLQSLTADLKQYCSSLDSTNKSQVLCQMIYIELTKAFKLPDKQRPSKTTYNVSWTAESICQIKKISLTNKWIWGLLSSEQRNMTGGDAETLCKQVTSSQETLRLARFFYKVAPRVRLADSSVANSGSFLSASQRIRCLRESRRKQRDETISHRRKRSSRSLAKAGNGGDVTQMICFANRSTARQFNGGNDEQRADCRCQRERRRCSRCTEEWDQEFD